eukprot:m.44011 g.44011  ORF g.44011 m.44011 type:complete len:428 (+) comp10856_c0_seq3:1008-2291(+)
MTHSSRVFSRGVKVSATRVTISARLLLCPASALDENSLGGWRAVSSMAVRSLFMRAMSRGAAPASATTASAAAQSVVAASPTPRPSSTARARSRVALSKADKERSMIGFSRMLSRPWRAAAGDGSVGVRTGLAPLLPPTLPPPPPPPAPLVALPTLAMELTLVPRVVPTSESARRSGGRVGPDSEVGTDAARWMAAGEASGEPVERGEGGRKLRSGLALRAEKSESLSWSASAAAARSASGLRRCMDMTRTPRPSVDSAYCDRWKDRSASAFPASDGSDVTCTLHRSRRTSLEHSTARNVSAMISSLTSPPTQPSTRARSFPVPNGMRPTRTCVRPRRSISRSTQPAVPSPPHTSTRMPSHSRTISSPGPGPPRERSSTWSGLSSRRHTRMMKAPSLLPLRALTKTSSGGREAEVAILNRFSGSRWM